MCFWGEALMLGPNINLPMPEDAVAPAYAAREGEGACHARQRLSGSGVTASNGTRRVTSIPVVSTPG